MIKQTMISVMVLLLAVVGVSGCLDSGSNNNTPNNSSNLSQNVNNVTNTTNITATQAQQLANQYIEQAGATAGTPQLTNVNGKQVYIVPIVLNGKTVGEIEIDATTGQNLGGAGGAP
ncbi:PepSY domain-containing protein [Methanobacterium sp. CWC-01]|uniref:PepSY domain-containing protein n=1 Tax=Methanobacterium aridiramus TaxID=2584467 RepID=UPI002576F856|nr:PepSY domain-containing protein [Methanobacterium sp. CWC-01]WJI09981.1 PepSY domain-containing protein [Methanobacterium sp. CWC-01]